MISREIKSTNTPIGYVVSHEGNSYTTASFDIFVRKGIRMDPSILSEDDVYDMEECEVAKKFAKEHPDYEYFGSEEWSGLRNRNRERKKRTHGTRPSNVSSISSSNSIYLFKQVVGIYR